MRKNPAFSLVAFFIFIVSCHTAYQAQSLQYKAYRINDSQQKDSSVLMLIKPYGDSVNKSMSDVVGFAEKTLDKKQPEGTLGNFMVDAFFAMAKEKYNTQVDVGFLNFGGIRLTQLPAGNVTRGKIFELMPFDNLLILQKMKGDVLQQLLDLIAAKGGWPVAGLTMQIRNKKAMNVMIGGKPIDMSTIYTTMNSDFIANGGDNADMLRPIPQITNGYLMRDALFDYIKKLKSEGKNISAKEENRVTHAE
ncbi:MAG: 5'-nucleotidase C-terminal domain-containing protein [Sphingobacteriales bacterium]|nr:5'-nucleotidase C-terminal domain-containing protein [Sphingobacteriales bacterium]